MNPSIAAGVKDCYALFVSDFSIRDLKMEASSAVVVGLQKIGKMCL